MIDTHGLTVTPAPAGLAWRVTGIERLSKSEGGNTPAIFVRAWNSDGSRAGNPNIRIRSVVALQPTQYYRLDKPDTSIERGHGDVPLSPSSVYQISIIDGVGHLSDTVDGLRSDQPIAGEDWGHVTWRLDFTLEAGDVPPVVVDPEPPSGGDCEALRAELRRLLVQAKAWVAEVERAIG